VRKLDRLGSEAGQGTVEYVLLLMVSIMIILGILYQFSTAFRVYSAAFFDGYIACLLETGELPGNAECELPTFNPTAGKALVKDTSNMKNRESSLGGSSGSSSSSNSSSSSGSGSGSGSANSQSKNGANSKSTGGSEIRGSGSGGSGTSYAGSSSQGSGFLKQRSSPVGRADTAAASNTSEGDSSNGLLAKVPATRAGDYGNGNGKTKALDRGFGYAGEAEANARAASKPAVAALTKPAEGGDNLRPTSSIEKGIRGPAEAKISDDSGFSFGYLLRWFLIIAIIIAIVVFFGGQLLQISKSQEK
jgi:hypothetical protein